MSPELSRGSQVFFGGRQSSGLTNLLLVLNLAGIIVIILLLLFWWPWQFGWGRGVQVVGAEGPGGTGAVSPGPGGNVIINAACCPGTPTGGECPKETCEELCKKDYPTDQRGYEKCVQSRCGKQNPCEKACDDKYGKGTTAAGACIKDNCGDDDCTKNCERRYPTDSVKMLDCIQNECNPPQTCEDECNQQYGAGTTAAQACVTDRCDKGSCENDCEKRYATAGTQYVEECVQRECNPPEDCKDYCKTVYGSPGMENYYQQCLQERCGEPTCEENCRAKYGISTAPYYQCMQENCYPQNPPQDCRDSDGYNLAVVGTIRAGQETHTDSCYSASMVTEWTCDNGKPKEQREPCANGYCQNGACVQNKPKQPEPNPCEEYCKQVYSSPGMETYYQQCLEQRQCPV